MRYTVIQSAAFVALLGLVQALPASNGIEVHQRRQVEPRNVAHAGSAEAASIEYLQARGNIDPFHHPYNYEHKGPANWVDPTDPKIAYKSWDIFKSKPYFVNLDTIAVSNDGKSLAIVKAFNSYDMTPTKERALLKDIVHAVWTDTDFGKKLTKSLEQIVISQVEERDTLSALKWLKPGNAVQKNGDWKLTYTSKNKDDWETLTDADWTKSVQKILTEFPGKSIESITVQKHGGDFTMVYKLKG